MLFWLLLHFIIGLAGAWMAREYAIRHNVLDHPGERRSHEVPTPRGGGIGIVIALLVAACVLGWRSPQQVILLLGFVVGLLLIAGTGIVDDHRPLSPWLRLGVQALAASILAVAVAGTSGDLWIAVIAFLAAMALTNIWNFMDGINGIAASQAVLMGSGIALALGGSGGWLALALAAACMGFLPFNFPRARIFLGDVGSGSLGFALAALLTTALMKNNVRGELLLLPLSAFLVDSGLTLARRVFRRERWWRPHAQHAYQRWAASVGTHTIVTLAYAGWTVAGWLLAWWLARRSEGQMAVGSVLWFVTTAALWIMLQRRYAIHNREPRIAATAKDRE